MTTDREKTKAITEALRHKYLKAQSGWSLIFEATLDDLDQLDGKKPTKRNRRRAPEPTRRRIDALLVRTAKSNKPYLETIALEIKVSRADFRRDTPEKRRRWQQATDRFAYVAPHGLIAKEEVPEGCGLIEYYGSGVLNWTVKAPLTLRLKPGLLEDPDFMAYALRRITWTEENQRRAA